jgi:hypothetical protein
MCGLEWRDIVTKFHKNSFSSIDEVDKAGKSMVRLRLIVKTRKLVNITSPTANHEWQLHFNKPSSETFVELSMLLEPQTYLLRILLSGTRIEPSVAVCLLHVITQLYRHAAKDLLHAESSSGTRNVSCCVMLPHRLQSMWFRAYLMKAISTSETSVSK